MTQYIYVESATGRAVSQTSDPDILSRIRPGYEVVQVDDEDINQICTDPLVGNPLCSYLNLIGLDIWRWRLM